MDYLIDQVSSIAGIDKEKHQTYLSVMVPILLEYAEDYCGATFVGYDPPAGVRLFIGESLRHKIKADGLSSRSMGSVSYSYDTDLPEKIKRNLKPYRRVRFHALR
ncbi:phage head-tail connector protein [Cytobacillus sp. FSL R5-0569]|uniref:phage head-tail connector protein n=1 Tax=Cytobacillus sp. FSL R5-0569 TaxID=2921649 RepID=UPI0030F821A5